MKAITKQAGESEIDKVIEIEIERVRHRQTERDLPSPLFLGSACLCVDLVRAS